MSSVTAEIKLWHVKITCCGKQDSNPQPGPRWQSGNLLESQLWYRTLNTGPTSSGKAGSCLP